MGLGDRPDLGDDRWRCAKCNAVTGMYGHMNGCPTDVKVPKRMARAEMQKALKDLTQKWDIAWTGSYKDTEIVEFQKADIHAFNDAINALKSQLE